MTAGGPLCVVLGGGGHARVVLDCLISSGVARPYAVLDRDRALWGTELMGVPILGGDELLSELAQGGVTGFVVGLGGAGDNGPRRRLYELGLAHRLAPVTVCHPSAVCSRWATLGEGSVLLPAAIVNAGAVLGANVIVNTGAIVEHDCVIGDHVHVATGARLASTVRVGAGAHIGAGATVRQCLSIGEGAVVGAGAVVVKDVPPWTVVTGVPARPLRRQDATRHGTGGLTT
ncbi:MAG: NeuD/PglB/VioB family sugar acetyltransferase [Armatimonadetes bacterium]|nr:NeuD/PglB/VioB family sugar acetyltransferase [Armatimonadota bacterium]